MDVRVSLGWYKYDQEFPLSVFFSLYLYYVSGKPWTADLNKTANISLLHNICLFSFFSS